MRRLVVLAVVLAVVLLSVSIRADCIGNGHYTIGTSRWPYTEDLVHHADDTPVGDPQTIRYDDQLRWTKIQGGCTAYDEQNIRAIAPVNVLLRASFNIAFNPAPTAPPGTRFEVQLRVDDVVVVSAIRTLHGTYPQSERFGGIVRDLPAGGHAYSMWMRMLDGPSSNAMTLGLQWITAQGMPSSLPAGGSASRDEQVTTDWKAIGGDLTIDAAEGVDVALLTSYRANGDGALMFAWSIDGESAGPHVIITASREDTLFDHAKGLEAGRHTLRLYARMTEGAMLLHELATSFVAFPRELVTPMRDALATDPVVVTSQGSDAQPLGMSDVCGRWTKILDVELVPSDGYPSWALDGYIEITGWTGEGTWAVLGIDASRFEHGRDEATDMGMFQFQLGPQHDGISFYGDCSKWGNYDQPTKLSLWLRRIEYCAGAPAGGTITVGRRWLGVKLLPSPTPHLR